MAVSSMVNARFRASSTLGLPCMNNSCTAGRQRKCREPNGTQERKSGSARRTYLAVAYDRYRKRQVANAGDRLDHILDIIRQSITVGGVSRHLEPHLQENAMRKVIVALAIVMGVLFVTAAERANGQAKDKKADQAPTKKDAAPAKKDVSTSEK